MDPKILTVLDYTADHENDETLTLAELPNMDLLLIYTFPDEDPEVQLWAARDKHNAWDAYLRRSEAMKEHS
ncbi:hypothetical protein [Spirillospora sp. NPDC047279]|uniref:hypothetical protein n=1 Tax=Spirillospora sp. NPDC047279 TaxID=3155478 RepID=UPI0033CCF279